VRFPIRFGLGISALSEAKLKCLGFIRAQLKMGLPLANKRFWKLMQDLATKGLDGPLPVDCASGNARNLDRT